MSESRRFFMEYNERTAETTVGLGTERLVFTAEEWERNRHHFGQVVHVEEKHPAIALFGTRTEIRWAQNSSDARLREEVAKVRDEMRVRANALQEYDAQYFVLIEMSERLTDALSGGSHREGTE